MFWMAAALGFAVHRRYYHSISTGQTNLRGGVEGRPFCWQWDSAHPEAKRNTYRRQVGAGLVRWGVCMHMLSSKQCPAHFRWKPFLTRPTLRSLVETPAARGGRGEGGG